MPGPSTITVCVRRILVHQSLNSMQCNVLSWPVVWRIQSDDRMPVSWLRGAAAATAMQLQDDGSSASQHLLLIPYQHPVGSV